VLSKERFASYSLSFLRAIAADGTRVSVRRSCEHVFVYRKDAERMQARRLRSLGWSLRRIAAELDVALSSVSRWVGDVAIAGAPDALVHSLPPEPQESETRRCGRCGADLPLSSFNRHRDGRQWWCRACFRAYFRDRGAEHRRQSAASLRRRRAAARRLVTEHLAGRACADCGEADPAVLEFDHVGPKRADIGRLVNAGAAAADLECELASCEIVCTNCHRRRTARRGRFWRTDPARLADDPLLLPGERRNLEYLHGVLSAAACRDCGCAELVVLDFDHVGPKRANVVELARRGSSLEALKAEIARCEVRCANCHRRRTALRRTSRTAT
jgi:hypothetical protein